MNAKEFRLQQEARWKASKESCLRSYREAEASVARYLVQEPQFGLVVSTLIVGHRFTKLWFDLLEWVLIMGALWYLHGQTESRIVLIVFYASLMLFALYVPIAVGRSFMFFRFPFVKSLAGKIVLSMCVSAASGFGVLYLLKSLVYEIAKHHE
jgi:hypothetical protein